MIAKWNSDINDGGKWLCGKVSSLCTQWKLSQERDDETQEQTDESWPQPGPGVPPADCSSHLQWALCRVCSTQGGSSPGGQVSAGSPSTPWGSFLRQPSAHYSSIVSLTPPTLVCHCQVHPTLTPDTKFRFENVRESTIIISYSWKSMFTSCNNSQDLSTDPT